MIIEVKVSVYIIASYFIMIKMTIMRGGGVGIKTALLIYNEFAYCIPLLVYDYLQVKQTLPVAYANTPPSAAYMRRLTWPSVDRIMVYHLFGVSINGDLLWIGNKQKWNSNRNTKFFNHENAFETVFREIGLFYPGEGKLIEKWWYIKQNSYLAWRSWLQE